MNEAVAELVTKPSKVICADPDTVPAGKPDKRVSNNENLLLNHLLREGITPSFSFPLDVCEFKAEGRVNGD